MYNTITKNNRVKKMQKDYQINHEYLSMLNSIMPTELDYKVPCSECTRRAFDFTSLSQGLLIVSLKCPHCHKIVQIPIHLGTFM